mgnify:CR=1 FL=1
MVVLVGGLVSAAPCRAYDVLLRWTVPPEPDIAGYRVHVGGASGSYSSMTDVGRADAATLNGVVYQLYPNLQLGQSYYVAVTAYDTAADGTDDWTEGHESWFSSDVSVRVRPTPLDGDGDRQIFGVVVMFPLPRVHEGRDRSART